MKEVLVMAAAVVAVVAEEVLVEVVVVPVGNINARHRLKWGLVRLMVHPRSTVALVVSILLTVPSFIMSCWPTPLPSTSVLTILMFMSVLS